VKRGEHHKVDSFYNRAQELVEDEVQIYTWKDATLLELTQLIQQVKPFARERGVQMKFNLVQPQRGKFTERYIGTVKGDAKRSEDDKRMLQDTSFEIGDYIDVAVVPQP
jgi:histone deacetylase complex subunit SAP18